MKNGFLVVCLFVILATVALAAAAGGTWTIQTGPNTPQTAGSPQTLVLNVNGSTLTGTIDGAPITGGGTSPNSIWFKATRNGVVYSYKGVVNGNQITLSEYKGQARTYTFTRNGN